ncbi:MAG: hypothetical protein R3Y15_03755 [Rikenellaceae bacterium]
MKISFYFRQEHPPLIASGVFKREGAYWFFDEIHLFFYKINQLVYFIFIDY